MASSIVTVIVMVTVTMVIITIVAITMVAIIIKVMNFQKDLHQNYH